MKIYISGCTREDGRMIKQTSDLLRSSKHQACYWNIGSEYSSEPLEQSDAVVFVLPGGTFQCPLVRMTQGSLKELVYCLNNKKDIFVSYKSNSGLRIYAAEITDTLCIKGISATYMNLDTIDEIKDSYHSEVKTIKESTERFY